MNKLKTKLKIDDAYFYAPYIPFYLEDVEEYWQLWKQFLKDTRRNEIFKDVED